jgi:HK97 family phage portal protein
MADNKKTAETQAKSPEKKSSVVLLGKRSSGGSQQIDSDEADGIFTDIGVLNPTVEFKTLIDLYSENATLQRCIDVSARAVTKNGYSILPDDATAEVPEDVKNFFEKGNPDCPYQIEMQDVITDLLNTGSAALEITRFMGSVDGLPVGFYRLPIKKVRVAKGRMDDEKYGTFRTGQRFVEIDETMKFKNQVVWYNNYTPERDRRVESEGFSRKPPKGSKQKKMTEIMWFKLSNPDSRYYGQSPAIALSRTLLMAKYTEEFNIDQFEHGWLQKFLFVVKRGSISDEQMMELEEYVEEVLHEDKKWNKVPIINLQGEDNADFEVKFLNQSQPEGAYLNLMKYLREQVYMAYGVPPILLNLVDNANRSNSRDQRETFYQDQVRPLQMLIGYKFTKMLREDFGFAGTFQFNKPDLTEMKEDSEIIKEMVAKGVITINEGREMLGLPKVQNIPYADMHLIFLPNGVFPIDSLSDEPIESKPGSEGDDAPAPAKKDKEEK